MEDIVVKKNNNDNSSSNIDEIKLEKEIDETKIQAITSRCDEMEVKEKGPAEVEEDDMSNNVVTDDNIASNVDVEEKKISNTDAAEDHKSEKKVEKSDKNETGLIEVKSPMEEDMEGDDESSLATVTNSDSTGEDSLSESSELRGGETVENNKTSLKLLEEMDEDGTVKKKRKRKLSTESKPFIPKQLGNMYGMKKSSKNQKKSQKSPVKIHVNFGLAKAVIKEFEPTIQSRMYHLNLLFSNPVAGSIIGVKGSTIVKLQEETKAKIKLSQVTELYPGTNDRIVLYRGNITEIVNALGLSVEKVIEENRQFVLMAQKNIHLKVVAPSEAVGTIIGRKGETVQEFCKRTNCKIKISPKDAIIPFLNERIIHVIGKPSNCMIAIALLMEKFNKSDEFALYKCGAANFYHVDGYENKNTFGHHTNSGMIPSPINAAAAMYGGMPAFANQFGYYTYSPTGLPYPHTNFDGSQHYDASYATIPSPLTNTDGTIVADHDYIGHHVEGGDAMQQQQEMDLQQQVAQYNAAFAGQVVSDTITVDMEIPKQFAGALLGPKGETIVKLQEQSGTTIQLSQNDATVKFRNIHISGTTYGCSTAQYLIREVLDNKKKEYESYFQQGLYQNNLKSRRGSKNGGVKKNYKKKGKKNQQGTNKNKKTRRNSKSAVQAVGNKKSSGDDGEKSKKNVVVEIRKDEKVEVTNDETTVESEETTDV